MASKVGAERERVTFQAYTDQGEGVYAWTDIGSQMWARVEPKSGTFVVAVAGGAKPRRYVVTTRFKTTIEEARRVLWRGKTLEANGGQNLDEHRMYLTFQVQESIATALVREIASGIAITLRRPANQVTDAAQPWNVTPAANTDIAMQALVDAYAVDEIDGTVVLRDDERLTIIMAADGAFTEPLPEDRVIYGGRTRTVVRVTRISPQDPILAYSLQVRG